MGDGTVAAMQERERPPAAPSPFAGKPAAAGVPRLSVVGASKTYGRARVLDDVGLQLQPGQVHAVIGQNGSGKSTLVKILSGVVRPDDGATMQVDGVAIALPSRPHDLNRAGVSFVHQDLGLIEDATVVENIRMGRLRRSPLTRRIRWREEIERCAETLRRLRTDIDPRTTLGELRPGQRALVAIARALQSHEPGRGCIVFDESTQSLPRESLKEFYAVVEQLAGEGTGVLLVSHRLDEVLTLAHCVTSLQDGRVTASAVSTEGLAESALARLVLGREIQLAELAKAQPRPAAASLVATGVHSPDLRGLDLTVRAGEILGVTGSTGSGHEQLAEVLGGAARGVRGTLTTPRGDTIDLARSGIAQHLDAGIALVPEQRAAEGVALEMSALENLTLPRIRGKRSETLFLHRRWQDAEFAAATELLGIVPPEPDLPVGSFSGGNQQKILLGKWLLGRPDVLVLHEPTQAVDIGARVDILRAVRAAADSGAAVVICSVEAQDLAYVCDRVLVLRHGREHRYFDDSIDGPLSANTILDAL